jgi:uncharacterized protein involved in outer membrane biogenesis
MRKLFVGALILAVIGVGGYFLLVKVLDPEVQRAALEQRLEEIFARPVTAGAMRVVLIPRFGVEIDGIQVAQDPEFGEGSVVSVDRVWANLGFWDYALERKPVIERLTLEGTRIALVKREDGVWNWATLGRRRSEPAAPTEVSNARGGFPFLASIMQLPDVKLPDVTNLGIDPRRVEIEQLDVGGATVTLQDRTSDPDTVVEYRNLALLASVAPEGEGYRVRGSVQADSAAAGGEPLVAGVPFDALLAPPTVERSIWLAQGNLGSGHFGTANLRLDAVTSAFSLDEAQTLRLDPLRVQLYGGTLEGNFAVNLGTPENRFATSGKIFDVGLAPAFAARPDLAGAFSGKLTTEFKAEGQLGDFNHTLQTMQGAGTLALADAQLSSINVLAEVARKGGFETIQFDEPGTHVERLEAAFRMQDGRLEIAHATLTNINGYANATVNAGWLDLKQPSSIDVSGAVTILPPLFEKVGKASPLADVVLAVVGSNGNLTVPLSIAGPLNQPAVAVRWEEVLTSFLPFGMALPPSN